MVVEFSENAEVKERIREERGLGFRGSEEVNGRREFVFVEREVKLLLKGRWVFGLEVFHLKVVQGFN